ncbi:transposase, partial [Virgibacillus oceani]
ESRWTSVNEYIHRVQIVDIDMGLDLFSPDRNKAIGLYIEYMKQPNNDQCLEDIVKIRRSDDEVREFLYQLGIQNKSTLQQMDKETRDAVLGKLKALKGVSQRQISRITGISKTVIQRAGGS